VINKMVVVVEIHNYMSKKEEQELDVYYPV
jgi:hypothetical protein